MVNYSKEYGQIFDYLSADKESSQETGLVVFGRKDLLVAHKAIELVQKEKALWAIITGGIGKDSGNLAIPEAEYLAAELYRQRDEHRLSLPPIYLETKATNGGENSRNSLEIVHALGLNDKIGITAVAHATSSRRLSEMLKHAAQNEGRDLEVYRAPSNYPFNVENPADQKEARSEILRLADWPSKNWLLPQDDLPYNLVGFVRDVESKEK